MEKSGHFRKHMNLLTGVHKRVQKTKQRVLLVSDFLNLWLYD